MIVLNSLALSKSSFASQIMSNLNIQILGENHKYSTLPALFDALFNKLKKGNTYVQRSAVNYALIRIICVVNKEVVTPPRLLRISHELRA